MFSTAAVYYMSYALQLAQQGHAVAPNPMVGCVIVKDDRIVGDGYHQVCGGPHAEVYALEKAGPAARGAELYVNLEPCCHHGRTPPCTDAIIAAGIKKVTIACIDPNPRVAGQGIARLTAAGIEVVTGISEVEAKKLNAAFFHYILHKKPFVIAKWAMSLDGKTITHRCDDRKISSHESHVHAHNLRSRVGAILIGANTARLDNPQLTARHQVCNAPTRQPLRIVLSRSGDLPENLQIFSPDLPGKTLLVTTQPANKFAHIENLVLPKNKKGMADLNELLLELGRREISSLLIEGGNEVHNQFFQANLINKAHVYLAPTFIGAQEKKQFFKNINFEKIGQDIFCEVD